MDCCCPGSEEPLQGVYVSNFQSTKVPSSKTKFSFRTTAPATLNQSQFSRNSSQSSIYD